MTPVENFGSLYAITMALDFRSFREISESLYDIG